MGQRGGTKYDRPKEGKSELESPILKADGEQGEGEPSNIRKKGVQGRRY